MTALSFSMFLQWEQTRLTEKQARMAITKLKQLDLIETKVWKFSGAPTMHIRIKEKVFLERWNTAIKNPRRYWNCPPTTLEEPAPSLVLPYRADGNAPQGRTITEITTEITSSRSSSGIEHRSGSSGSSLDDDDGKFKWEQHIYETLVPPEQRTEKGKPTNFPAKMADSPYTAQPDTVQPYTVKPETLVITDRVITEGSSTEAPSTDRDRDHHHHLMDQERQEKDDDDDERRVEKAKDILSPPQRLSSTEEPTEPVDQVDLSTDFDRGQYSLFNEECEGLCDV